MSNIDILCIIILINIAIIMYLYIQLKRERYINFMMNELLNKTVEHFNKVLSDIKMSEEIDVKKYVERNKINDNI